MNRDELQKVLVALDKCCESTNRMYTVIEDSVDDWISNLETDSDSLEEALDEVIEIISDWAATYSATYSDFICQQEDNEDIAFEIEFENYLCMQTDVTTTTTTLATTTTTTINQRQVDWTLSFEDYQCMQWDDPDEPELKSGEVVVVVAYSGTYEVFECMQENNPDITTTTTTYLGTTTTSTTVAPGLVQWIGYFNTHICQQEDNPNITTTTTTRGQVVETVAFDIEFKDYKCMQTDVTTTTTTPAVTTTTTTAALTTTTTTTNLPCNTEMTGTTAFPQVYAINVGSQTGELTLTVDAIEVPDKFVVEIDGVEVFNTGYRGDAGFQTALYESLLAHGAAYELITGAATGTFIFNKTSESSIAIVKVYAPMEESEYSFTLSCVRPVTTTTTTSGEAWTGTYSDFICGEIDDPSITTTTTTIAPIVTTTTTTAEVPVGIITCGETWHTGGEAYPYLYIVIGLGTGIGWVDFSIDTKDIPDKFIVEFNGLEVINTGYRGNVSLQSELNAALAAHGDSPEVIQTLEDNHFYFYKTGSTQNAIVKVYAPMPETQWEFRFRCPDGATTTTTTTPVTTTTTTVAATTTTTMAATTTTTNAPPVSGTNTLTNTRTTCSQTKTIVPADFTFTDANGDALEYVKIVSYSIAGAGSLRYNGVAVTNNQVIQVYGGATGSFLYSLVYTPDASLEDAYSDTITYQVRTSNNVNFG